ncbi:IclR family transcriptional regulator [Leucothrix arctica]|uniref:IclR family transcriptional regulator n=1 Tax=Leucothrix arctica TaxID=1481894 RepID=A0A317CBR3_9GAMM|nr:IclR family transcriptional regulator [Leucothrix arctica]PWQ93522.1 IclR family transcriptional regulator [Leucothrix arctica]
MANTDKGESRSGIQVIARAAAVLRELKGNTSGMSIGQIAERLELPRSTVQRIVGALKEERLVIASSSSGGLRLGPELHALAGAARYDIVELCKPHLSDLVAKTGETADLSVLRDNKMIFLDQVQGSHRLRTVSVVGSTFPLTTTANGIACLSMLDDEQVSKLVHTEWDKEGINGDFEALLARVSRARDNGLSYDREYHSRGVSAIGFAFRDSLNEVYSISVPVPSSRFDELEEHVSNTLRILKIEIEHLMVG